MFPLIHIWAILASMILSVILGFIWYGPLFGKAWMKLAGIVMPEGKPSFAVIAKPIIISLVGAFLMTFVLSFSIAFHNAYYQTSGLVPAYSITILLWLGFIVPLYANFLGWENKPVKLFFINAGYWLVFMLLAATLIVLL